jgi:hypothetical protein
MEKFRDMIDEMAMNRGSITHGADSREKEWLNTSDNHKDLIRDRIGSNHYKVYQVGSTYFLTTENNEYLGYIEFDITRKYHIIRMSSSNIERGFYIIMFTTILSSGVKEIVSDSMLSTNAIKSYEKINKSKSSISLKVTDGVNYWDFSREMLLNDDSYRVSVKEKHDLNELFNEYYNRIDEDLEYNGVTTPSSYKRSYENKTETCDWFLFGNLDNMKGI